VEVFPGSKILIETLLPRIQGDIDMTLRNMADQQVYQNLNQKSKTGKQNKIKTTEGKWDCYFFVYFCI
jgi:hypothetical protein